MPQKNNILKISDYTIKQGDVFFFDNNIWMYIFCPLANFKSKKQKVYSNFFSYIINRKSHVFINSLVLSEFCNRYLRLDFDLCNKMSNPQIFKSFKKDYVGSRQFEKTVKELKIHLTNIIKMSQKCSDEFNSINMDEILELFATIGFNDAYYTYQSKNKKWIIVSDDSDFSSNKTPQTGVTILTI
jgi:hypothetical protein